MHGLGTAWRQMLPHSVRSMHRIAVLQCSWTESGVAPTVYGQAIWGSETGGLGYMFEGDTVLQYVTSGCVCEEPLPGNVQSYIFDLSTQWWCSVPSRVCSSLGSVQSY